MLPTLPAKRGGLYNHPDAAIPPMYLLDIAFFVFLVLLHLWLLLEGEMAVLRQEGDFLGPARIVRAEMHTHLIIIFGVMAKWRIHVEMGVQHIIGQNADSIRRAQQC
jgi:hypothetical protein